jgi:hypothetical protein
MMRLLPPYPDDKASGNPSSLALTDGEVNFILGFIHDGSIGAEPWHRLMGAWGYCEYHAWASFAVEMSALGGFVSRSAFLYFDLLRRAVAVLAPQTSRNQRAVAKQLTERNPCMICEINPRRRGWLSDAELAEAKDQTRLRQFAESLAPLWLGDCCPQCIAAKPPGRLCRRHLEAAIMAKKPVSLDENYRYLSRSKTMQGRSCGGIATATAPKTVLPCFQQLVGAAAGRAWLRSSAIILRKRIDRLRVLE